MKTRMIRLVVICSIATVVMAAEPVKRDFEADAMGSHVG